VPYLIKRSMGENTLMIGTDCAEAAESIRKLPGPNCATARRSRARSCGVEFKSARAG
jgi:hypothetical protein